MKKIILSVSIFLSLAVFSAGATDGITVSREVQASFQKEFPAAEVLNWNTAGDYLRASFLLDGHRTEAYFSEEGEFLGSIRYLFFNQLPLATMKAVDKSYPDADILEVMEVTNQEGTTYRVTLERLQKKLRVKVDGNGNITQSDRIKN